MNRYKVTFYVDALEEENRLDALKRIGDWLETDLDSNNTGDCYKDLEMGRILVEKVESEE